MSLPRRFAVLVGALLVATFVTCTAGVFGLDSLERELRATVDVDVARLIRVTHTRRFFRSMLVLERDILLETEPTKRALLVAKTASARHDLAIELAAYRRVAERDEGRDRHLPRYGVARRLVIGVSVLAALTGLVAGALVFRGIRSAMIRVVEVNANLETIVDERTRALRERERTDDATTKGRSKILVVVRDVTARIEAERAEREARETQVLVAQLLSNAEGFASFVKEGSALIHKVSAPRNAAALMRDLHTLKGNGYVFGFLSLGAVCHELEGVVGQEGALTAEHLQRLDAVWASGMKRLEGFITGDVDALHVSRESYEALLVSLKNREAHEAIVTVVESWRRESTGPILRRLAAATERIAGSLGKHVEVQVDDGSVLLPPNVYDELWSSRVHLVRNATYHGIEAPAARAVAAKPERGMTRLATRIRTDGRLTIEVSDDGRGIDFAALALAAKGRGILATSEAELLRAMFAGKLSTAGDVSEVAGRGVGVAAAVEACERLEGRVHVDTEVGRGTRFRFSLPPPQCGDALRV